VPPPGLETLISALRSDGNDEVALTISNNMEDAASALVAEVADALAWLRGLPGVMSATVAGSGSAVFGLCSDAVASRDAAQRAIERGFWAVATTTRDHTVQVERMCETG
jgi:4-diphosphocytidyl-2-C-methyl-D-erythritol kinase